MSQTSKPADGHFSTLNQVRSGTKTRWFARFLLLLFIVTPFALLVIPWQQTVSGRGQVVAFAPTERKQVITALVPGRVAKWHVVENDHVKRGDPIADIDDNDPGLSDRLQEQKKFLSSRKEAALEEIAEQKKAVEAAEKAMMAAVGAAKANRDAAKMMVNVTEETKKNNEFAVAFEKRRFEMNERLFKGEKLENISGLPGQSPTMKLNGLVSAIDRDEALMRFDRAGTDVKRAEAEIDRAKATVLTNESLIVQAEATGLSTIATTRRDLRRAEQNLFGIERELQDIENRIERFKARFIRSPVDGVIYRIAADGQTGQFVKEGDELAIIVPETKDRVVELMIDGVDAPLISAHMQNTKDGPHVRLQFEGWPGVQFAGWPSVAVGTFGGKVRQMDPTDDGKGRFRILVEPDQMFEGDVWPEGIFLRQGNQAVGWVFLNRVSLGYELWRQFNGFPPVIAPQAPDKDKKDGGKPPKIKPGG